MKAALDASIARADFPKLLRSKETVAISRGGRTVAFIVPRERMEAILETMELLASPKVMAAIRRDRSGKGRYLPVSALDEDED